MHALVIHESLFGNTRRVAEAIGSALQPGAEVQVVHAAEVTAEMVAQADLLVVGAPTHVHGLSRASTRSSTVKQGVHAEVAAASGVRELLAWIRPRCGTAAAAFDTRLHGPQWFTGAASHPIAAHLRRLGCRVVMPPESFVVRRTEGPLDVGEVERAGEWGARVLLAACVRGGVPVGVS